MKKTIKAFILIFTFMICVSLIGGAYALYVKNADNIEISFTAKPVEPWAPVVGAYYIVGGDANTLGGWSVNEKSIKMNAPAQGSTDLAQWTGTIPAGTEFKCVKYNGPNADPTWYNLEYTGGYGSPAKIDVYGDGEGGVTQVNGNMCAPASGEPIFVCVNGSQYSWGQTTASQNK